MPDDQTEGCTARLVRALTEAEDPELLIIRERAKRDYYHDFKSPLPMPEHQLVEDLRRVGRDDIAQRVIDGEFDADKWESEEWARSPEGQDAFRKLMEGR